MISSFESGYANPYAARTARSRAWCAFSSPRRALIVELCEGALLEIDFGGVGRVEPRFAEASTPSAGATPSPPTSPSPKSNNASPKQIPKTFTSAPRTFIPLPDSYISPTNEVSAQFTSGRRSL